MIKLAFDTQFWGVAFYECEVADLPLADSLDEPCLIQLKLNELAYYSASEALSNRAFFYGGSCVEYEKAIPKKMDLDNLKHAAYIEKYREAILQLAESSFTYSRYRPIFDDHLVRKFYRLWAEKSIQG